MPFGWTAIAVFKNQLLGWEVLFGLLTFILLFQPNGWVNMGKTLFNIALILLATQIGGIISRKLKMPEVLGALLAGVMLGPMALHLIQYDASIKLLSNLGVILLMFLIGMETNVGQFKKAGKSSFVISVTGITITLIMGTLGAFLFFKSPMENLFIGVLLTSTSVSIVAETLTEMRKLNTRPGINILGAAVIDDVLGLVLFSILLDIYSGGGSTLAAKMVGIGAFCLVGILTIVFLPKFINKWTRNVIPGRMLLTLTLALALLAGCVAESVGFAAITGAYLFGLLLSQFTHKEYLERNVQVISSGFLSPIFFASVGLEANLTGFNLNVALLTMTMFVIAVVGKFIGCGAAARLFRMSRGEAMQIGVGMISRGEVTIITANIGLQNHIISQEIFFPIILVVLLTTIVTPVLLKISFHHKNEMRTNK